MGTVWRSLFVLATASLVCGLSALAWAGPEVPPALAPWTGFALYGASEKLCPPQGNQPDARICRFPTRLDLDVTGDGADMTFAVRLFDEGTVALPHGDGAWTLAVRQGGAPVPVTDGPSGPQVWLPAGEYILTGRIAWNIQPASLRLPPDVGVVHLSRGGVPVPVAISPAGELRLAPAQSPKPVQNRETVRVFRLIGDGVPVTVTTLYRLEISGLARSVTLAGAVPAGSLPQAVRSPVPASLGPDGSVVLDAGPGRYEVEVVARYPGKIAQVGPAACPYGREIWSFRAGEIREVRPEGLPGIDPKTADVPGGWQAFATFAAAPGATLTLAELGRGAPLGRDALTLSRELWLDFSGQGLSVRDAVVGENRRSWTMAMLAPGELGRVTASGQDQPVVRLGEDGLSGVELRQSHVNLAARARYPDVSAAIPAGGYDREFERVTATLHLPPGWSLVAASGPDTVTGGLLSRWTLLDLFLVFLLAVAAFSLRGVWAGVALGLFLLLSWHEPNAPTAVWIFVLAGLGLLRAAGDVERLSGHPAFRRLALTLFILSMLSLVVLAVPFITRELRLAVAPQIGPGSPVVMAELQRQASTNEAMPAPVPSAPRAKAKDAMPMRAMAGAAGQPPEATDRLEFDPNALIQTGPAMPTWNFAAVGLSWRGPVAAGETFRLTLMPPVVSMLLGFARVILLGVALVVLFDRERVRRLAASAGAAAILLLLVLASSATVASAADFPPRELLDSLRARLVEPPRCLPHCLGSPGLDVRLEGGILTLTTALDAAVRSVAPLPVVSEDWRPATVAVDGKPAAALVRQDGALSVLLEPGSHSLILSGPAPQAVSFTIAAPLSPGRVRVAAAGYRVRGLDDRGVLTGPLELTQAETTSPAGPVKAGPAGVDIPAFFEIRRSLNFGLTFEIATEVVRLSPAGVTAVASVPLVAGELPDAAGVSVTGGQAVVSFAPGQDRVAWRSKLPAVPRLVLTAPANDALVETWTVAAAALYNVVFTGLPPVAWLSPDGRYAPRFLPWPGESLTIAVTRPEIAPGEYLTLERAGLAVRQGLQMRDATLSMAFRSAKGARHAVKLPAGAEVTRLTVAGRETLPTGEAGEVGFALPPGVTEVVLNLRERTPLGFLTETPAVDLGIPGTNVAVTLELPAERWLLAVRGATPLAPAVLFWGWLAAVAAIGLGLSCLRDTPLTRLGWLAYALGLSQATPANFLLAVAWIAALSWRRRHPISGGTVVFNITQALLVLLALAGFEALYETLGTGLLGLPRMQVAGNGSTATMLAWTFDRVAGLTPTCSAVTVPLLVFRGVMLLWALWLAWSLLRWLRWGFDSLTTGGGWRKVTLAMRLPGRGRSGDGQGGPGGPDREAQQKP
ncbi:hypothetical protein [Desulfovibrio sp. TomC]|uniref:hypothetical protein n=1 Tax=Desulfovibrio sp. TomC TaxID=1562888 RepID=UPI0005743952|nr:hypothetical protein [Desulfovibrio sp. TomC]KHK03599.1 hypothetical protein NY78_1187 [Desulfovibrio sp. TomC]